VLSTWSLLFVIRVFMYPNGACLDDPGKRHADREPTFFELEFSCGVTARQIDIPFAAHLGPVSDSGKHVVTLQLRVILQ
jgi:hypothetical protein